MFYRDYEKGVSAGIGYIDLYNMETDKLERILAGLNADIDDSDPKDRSLHAMIQQRGRILQILKMRMKPSANYDIKYLNPHDEDIKFIKETVAGEDSETLRNNIKILGRSGDRIANPESEYLQIAKDELLKRQRVSANFALESNPEPQPIEDRDNNPEWERAEEVAWKEVPSDEQYPIRFGVREPAYRQEDDSYAFQHNEPFQDFLNRYIPDWRELDADQLVAETFRLLPEETSGNPGGFYYEIFDTDAPDQSALGFSTHMAEQFLNGMVNFSIRYYPPGTAAYRIPATEREAIRHYQSAVRLATMEKKIKGSISEASYDRVNRYVEALEAAGITSEQIVKIGSDVAKYENDNYPESLQIRNAPSLNTEEYLSGHVPTINIAYDDLAEMGHDHDTYIVETTKIPQSEPLTDFLDRYIPNWRSMTPMERRIELDNLQTIIKFEYEERMIHGATKWEEHPDWERVEINNDLPDKLQEIIRTGIESENNDIFFMVYYYPHNTAAFATDKPLEYFMAEDGLLAFFNEFDGKQVILEMRAKGYKYRGKRLEALDGREVAYWTNLSRKSEIGNRDIVLAFSPGYLYELPNAVQIGTTAYFATEAKPYLNDRLADRLESLKRMSIVSIRNALSALENAGYDTYPVEEAESVFSDLERSDYEDAEEYQEAREEAWLDVINTIRELDQPESEEDEPRPNYSNTDQPITATELNELSGTQLLHLARDIMGIDLEGVNNRSNVIAAIESEDAKFPFIRSYQQSIALYQKKSAQQTYNGHIVHTVELRDENGNAIPVSFYKLNHHIDNIKALSMTSNQWEVQARNSIEEVSDRRISLRAQFAADTARSAAKLLASQGCCILIAVSQGNIIGLAIYHFFTDKTALISLVAIQPLDQPDFPSYEHIKIRGIGSSLLCYISEDLLEHNIAKVCLKPLDEAAERFWTNRGFNHFGVQLCVVSEDELQQLSRSCQQPDIPSIQECCQIGDANEIKDVEGNDTKAYYAPYRAQYELEYPEPQSINQYDTPGYSRNKMTDEKVDQLNEDLASSDSYPIVGDQFHQSEPLINFLNRYISDWKEIDYNTLRLELESIWTKQFHFEIFNIFYPDEFLSFEQAANFVNGSEKMSNWSDTFHVKYYPKNTAAFSNKKVGIKLYHGTVPDRADSIRSQGLNPGSYMSPDIDLAELHARAVARQVNIPESDIVVLDFIVDPSEAHDVMKKDNPTSIYDFYTSGVWITTERIWPEEYSKFALESNPTPRNFYQRAIDLGAEGRAKDVFTDPEAIELSDRIGDAIRGIEEITGEDYTNKEYNKLDKSFHSEALSSFLDRYIFDWRDLDEETLKLELKYLSRKMVFSIDDDSDQVFPTMYHMVDVNDTLRPSGYTVWTPKIMTMPEKLVVRYYPAGSAGFSSIEDEMDITPEDQELITHINAEIAKLTNLGRRTEIVHSRNAHIIEWSNGSAEWWVYRSGQYGSGSLIINRELNLDANQVLIYVPLYKLDKILQWLNPLPLYEGSYEYKKLKDQYGFWTDEPPEPIGIYNNADILVREPGPNGTEVLVLKSNPLIHKSNYYMVLVRDTDADEDVGYTRFGSWSQALVYAIKAMDWSKYKYKDIPTPAPKSFNRTTGREAIIPFLDREVEGWRKKSGREILDDLSKLKVRLRRAEIGSGPAVIIGGVRVSGVEYIP